MAIRPFPFQFRIGTDICRVERIMRIICKPNSLDVNTVRLNRFLRRIFNRAELSLFNSSVSGANVAKVAEHLAGRWAAKEAIIKASRRKIFMKDVIIYRETTTEAPQAVILDQNSQTDKVLSKDSSKELDLTGQSVLLTISHENDYAIATALVPD